MQSAAGMWIVIGDIHDETGNLNRIPELDQADGIIVTGDLTVNGGAVQAARVLDALRASGLPVFAQIGNMDLPEVDGWLGGQGVNLHGAVREIAPGLALLGIGGSTITPFHTPSEFSEDQYREWLSAEWQKAKDFPLRILVSHNPPRDTLCDDIGNGVHVGSVAVREFLEREQIPLCLCGHIHEARAEDAIGKTKIVNPGMLAQGGYVLVRLRDGSLEAELRQIAEAR